MKGRRWLALVVMLVALLGAACSSGDGDSSSGTTSGVAGAPAGTLRQGVDFDFPGFDVMEGNAATAMPFLRPVYDPLILPAADGSYEPWLATEWTVDETTVTLTIREGVKFADGSELDAAAVAANFERGKKLYDAGTSQVATYGDLASVSAPDATTVVLELTEPSSTFVTGLAGPAGLVMAPSSFDDPDLDRNPIGSGPYRYDSGVEAGAVIIYQASPDYWAEGVQGVETVELHVLSDGSARQNALLSGEIDVAVLDAAVAVDLAEDDTWQLTTTPEVTNAIVVLDREGTKQPALADVRVRQAMAYAIDRKTFVEVLLGGLGVASAQPFSEISLAYVPELTDAFSFDQNKAKALLDEAGYSDGIQVNAPTIPPIADFITSMQGFLGEVGIDMKLQAIDPGQYVAAPGTGDYEVWAATLPFASGEATTLYNALFAPDGLINGFKVVDSELAALNAEALTLTDPAARAEVEAEMNERIVNQGYLITAAVGDRVAVYGQKVSGEFRWFSGDGQPSFWGIGVS